MSIDMNFTPGSRAGMGIRILTGVRIVMSHRLSPPFRIKG
jgi:hypothetical protein